MVGSAQLLKEFQLYRDLIWIDQAEVYDAETSVLTYKTQSFTSSVHREMKKFDNERGGIKYSYYNEDEECENTAIWVERVVADLMALTAAVAKALR